MSTRSVVPLPRPKHVHTVPGVHVTVTVGLSWQPVCVVEGRIRIVPHVLSFEVKVVATRPRCADDVHVGQTFV